MSDTDWNLLLVLGACAYGGGMWLLIRQLRRGELWRYWWQVYFSLQLVMMCFNIFGGYQLRTANLRAFGIHFLLWISLFTLFAVFRRGRAFLLNLMVPFLFMGSAHLTRHLTLNQVRAAKVTGDALMDRIIDFREETGGTPNSLEELSQYDGQVLPGTGLWVLGGSEFFYSRHGGGKKCNLYIQSYLGTLWTRDLRGDWYIAND